MAVAVAAAAGAVVVAAGGAVAGREPDEIGAEKTRNSFARVVRVESPKLFCARRAESKSGSRRKSETVKGFLFLPSFSPFALPFLLWR